MLFWFFLYCNQDIRTNDDTTTHILEPLPYDFYIFCIIIFTFTTYYTSVLCALLIYEKCYFWTELAKQDFFSV